MLLLTTSVPQAHASRQSNKMLHAMGVSHGNVELPRRQKEPWMPFSLHTNVIAQRDVGGTCSGKHTITLIFLSSTENMGMQAYHAR